MRKQASRAPSAVAVGVFFAVILGEAIFWRARSLIGFSNVELVELISGLLILPILGGGLTYVACGGLACE